MPAIEMITEASLHEISEAFSASIKAIESLKNGGLITNKQYTAHLLYRMIAFKTGFRFLNDHHQTLTPALFLAMKNYYFAIELEDLKNAHCQVLELIKIEQEEVAAQFMKNAHPSTINLDAQVIREYQQALKENQSISLSRLKSVLVASTRLLIYQKNKNIYPSLLLQICPKLLTEINDRVKIQVAQSASLSNIRATYQKVCQYNESSMPDDSLRDYYHMAKSYAMLAFYQSSQLHLREETAIMARDTDCFDYSLVDLATKEIALINQAYQKQTARIEEIPIAAKTRARQKSIAGLTVARLAFLPDPGPSALLLLRTMPPGVK